MTQPDPLLNELSQMAGMDGDCALAQRHAPRLRFDANEPFFPLAVGYTIFRTPAKSPSSKFTIDPDNGIAIEYAIWWDWDIQHLYELEHVWVYLDADETLLRVEASAHGSKFSMIREDSSLPIEDARITIYSEPGKHGFGSNKQYMLSISERNILSCGDEAGKGGILTSNPFGAAAFGSPTAQEHQLAKCYMQRLAFTPTYEFSQIFDLRSVPFITWEQLQDWIPRRIIWWRSELVRIVPPC